jgi:hypothetical protein
VAKSIPILAEAAAGAFLYLSLRRLDRWLAWLALLLYLTAYQVLMGASAMDGENLATAFLLAALFALTRGHLEVAGALAGLSMGTVLYTAPGVIALAAATATLRRTGPLRFALGFLATFGLLAVLFGTLGGRGFWTGVVGYHLAKTPGADHVPLFGSLNPIHVARAFLHDAAFFLGGKTFGRSLFFHLPLYVAAVIGTAVAVVGRLRDAPQAGGQGREGNTSLPLPSLTPGREPSARSFAWRRQALVIPCAATALAFLAFWSGLSEVYDFYTVPMVAFLAVPAANGLLFLGRALRPGASTRALVACAVAGAAFCLHVPLASSLERALWPEEAARAGETLRFEWRAPSAFRPLALLSRGLFFAEARVRGEAQPPYRHFQWNKMLEFSTSEAIAAYVRASSSPDETLTGASGYAPLVALLADRRMAADEADTNAKRFKTGLLTAPDFYDRVCRDRLRFIVSAPRSPFALQALAADPTASRYFERAQTFEEGKLRHAGVEQLAVFRRRDDVVPSRPGMVCAAVDAVGGADGVVR